MWNIPQILIFGFTGVHNFAGVAAFSALDGIAYGQSITPSMLVGSSLIA
jgi:hypothetical protein